MSADDKVYATAARLDRHITTHSGTGTLTEVGSLSNSWHKNSGDGYFKYQQIGRLCYIFIRNIYPATTADGTVVCSAANGLPSAVRPQKVVSLICNTDALKPGGGTPGVTTAALHFHEDGSVTCHGIQMQATFVDCFGVFNIDAS